MSVLSNVRGVGADFLSAVQFLTRVPVSLPSFDSNSLARSVKFFPVVGLLVGASAALLHLLLAPHLQRLATAFVVIAYLVLITGCFHEDGLADAADGLGGGWTREQVLTIFRDSRIGSYGGAALALSLIGRVLLLSQLPLSIVPQYLIAAHILCRWTTLPLSFFLPPARAQSEEGADGQGARIARLTTGGALVAGSLFSLAVVIALLRAQAAFAIGAAIAISLLTGAYYRKRIGGVTGDCFGATNQITEIAVYLCGAWIA
jgi:adenosylcobinamide-GDP ribazoletransferase